MRNSILTFILFFYFSCFSQPAINKNYNFKKVRSIEVLPIMLVLILVLKGLKSSNNEPTNGEIIIISADQYILSFQPRNIFNINTIFISI